MRAFFDRWVFGAGHPQLRVGATYDVERRALTLTIDQQQKIDAENPPFAFDVDLEVDAAPAQLQNARRGVGNGAHDDVLDLRRSAFVLIERLEHHAIVGAEIDDLVRPGSNRLRLEHVGIGTGRKDAEIQIVEQSRIGFFQFEDDRVIVGRFDVVDRGVA